MKKNKLNDLVEKQRLHRNKVLREKYRLARDLGFTATEAMILQKKSKQAIIDAAEKRKDGRHEG